MGMMRLLGVGVMVLGLCQCGWMGPAGGSSAEQRAFIDEECEKVIEQLERQVPKALGEIHDSEGYAVFRYSSGKLPIVLGGLGAGGGCGVAVDPRDSSRSYMKVQKLNWGWGMGVKENSVVFVFSDRAVFEKFRKGKWDGGAAADATVKAGGVGGGLSGEASLKSGYHAYEMTDSGLSYGITYRTRRFSPIGKLNR